MMTKDHEAVGEFLLSQMDYPVSKKIKTAFLLGNVEPDFNPITYLRGSIRNQAFRGHNYDNVHDCISMLISRIEKEKMSDVRRFYLLGKLTHYIADSFTFPHNRQFTGSISDHCKYESELHTYMHEMLNYDQIICSQIDPEKNLMEQIEVLHDKYITDQKGFVTDCSYILSAVTLVFGYFTEMSELYLKESIA